MILALAAAFAGTGPSESVLPSAVRDQAVDAANLPLASRLGAVSRAMLGHTYINDPLGEGVGHDLDPRVRYDAWDCLTFTEEVLALALAGDPDHAGDVREALRYEDGEASYATRNHFMELQWIPQAIEQGWVRDSTLDYGSAVTHLERVVDASTWKAWRSRGKFAMDDAQLPTGTMALDVIPIDQALTLADRIPPGTIVLTVREDRTSSPIWVTHVGIVVPAEAPTVRHATKMGQGSTRDHGLGWYIDHLRTYDNWPALGVAFLEPVDFGPRIARLTQ